MAEHRSWVEVDADSDFPLANLPYGVARRGGWAEPHVVVAIGDRAVDLHRLQEIGLLAGVDLPAGVFAGGSLNPFLAAGPDRWSALRRRLTELLTDGEATLRDHAAVDDMVVPQAGLDLLLPIEVADYVDGYAGIHHATNLGRLFRPDGEPLLPNWRHLPVAYHGRAGTVVVSGTPVVRPWGQVVEGGQPVHRPTAQLDIELELGVVVGVGSTLGTPVSIGDVDRHVFGLVLLNDWSARDIQAFEYQPLGPYLGKSFATSISPWVVPFDALRPHLVDGLAAGQDPPPTHYLQGGGPWVPDLHLEVVLEPAGGEPVVLSRVDVADALYWSLAQQVAHATVNGAALRTGDLFGTGTLSGPDPLTQAGSLIERTWRGERPLSLPGGGRRSFLEDGDRVVLRGHAGGDGSPRIGLGAVEGTVVAR